MEAVAELAMELEMEMGMTSTAWQPCCWSWMERLMNRGVFGEVFVQNTREMPWMPRIFTDTAAR